MSEQITGLRPDRNECILLWDALPGAVGYQCRVNRKVTIATGTDTTPITGMIDVTDPSLSLFRKELVHVVHNFDDPHYGGQLYEIEIWPIMPGGTSGTPLVSEFHLMNSKPVLGKPQPAPAAEPGSQPPAPQPPSGTAPQPAPVEVVVSNLEVIPDEFGFLWKTEPHARFVKLLIEQLRDDGTKEKDLSHGVIPNVVDAIGLREDEIGRLDTNANFRITVTPVSDETNPQPIGNEAKLVFHIEDRKAVAGPKPAVAAEPPPAAPTPRPRPTVQLPPSGAAPPRPVPTDVEAEAERLRNEIAAATQREQLLNAELSAQAGRERQRQAELAEAAAREQRLNTELAEATQREQRLSTELAARRAELAAAAATPPPAGTSATRPATGAPPPQPPAATAAAVAAPPPPPPPSRRGNWRLVGLIAGGLLLLALIAYMACKLWGPGSSQVAASQIPSRPSAPFMVASNLAQVTVGTNIMSMNVSGSSNINLVQIGYFDAEVSECVEFIPYSGPLIPAEPYPQPEWTNAPPQQTNAAPPPQPQPAPAPPLPNQPQPQPQAPPPGPTSSMQPPWPWLYQPTAGSDQSQCYSQQQPYCPQYSSYGGCAPSLVFSFGFGSGYGSKGYRHGFDPRWRGGRINNDFYFGRNCPPKWGGNSGNGWHGGGNGGWNGSGNGWHGGGGGNRGGGGGRHR